MKLLSVIAIFGLVGVACGAFGAHGLADAVSPERLATFKTGALYHLLHVVAALAVYQNLKFKKVAYIWLAGITLFSGSLYLLVIFDLPALGIVTPIGGLTFMAGWLYLAILAWQNND